MQAQHLLSSKSLYSRKHRWFSGRMLACHAGGPGSIPGRCKFSFLLSFFGINTLYNVSIWILKLSFKLIEQNISSVSLTKYIIRNVDYVFPTFWISSLSINNSHIQHTKVYTNLQTSLQLISINTYTFCSFTFSQSSLNCSNLLLFHHYFYCHILWIIAYCYFHTSFANWLIKLHILRRRNKRIRFASPSLNLIAASILRSLKEDGRELPKRYHQLRGLRVAWTKRPLFLLSAF